MQALTDFESRISLFEKISYFHKMKMHYNVMVIDICIMWACIACVTDEP